MSALYIHIPFCKQICYYCDFYFSLTLKNKDRMVDALIQEINLRSNYLNDNNLTTIYFGGGTPSVLSLSDINRIFEAINANFNTESVTEVTFEANPDDLTDSYLQDLRSTPINRLSIGIQSFDDAHLKLMNRRHTAQQAIDCLDRVFAAGFDNVTADLMYSLPDMDIAGLQRNMDILLRYPINHISAYNLSIEPKTAFGKMARNEALNLPTENQAIEQSDFLRSYLAENGFDQYEISNFARDGHYSKHNSGYWQQVQYLGIGPSAHSYNGSSRQWNVSNNNRYLDLLSSGQPFFEREELTMTDLHNEYIFTGLRTKWGVSSQYILDHFGQKQLMNFLATAKIFVDQGFMFQQDYQFILTDKGKAIADGIASDLFSTL